MFYIFSLKGNLTILSPDLNQNNLYKILGSGHAPDLEHPLVVSYAYLALSLKLSIQTLGM